MAYTRQPAGRVTRLSVAVLIDNLRTTDKDGKVTETPLPQDQIDRLTSLVRDAVGFDQARGDSVNVVNSSFLGTAAPEEGELESVPIWEKAWVQTLAKVLAGVIVLLIIIFSVLKPLTRGLINAAKMPAAAPGRAGHGRWCRRSRSARGAGDCLRTAGRAGARHGGGRSQARRTGREVMGIER